MDRLNKFNELNRNTYISAMNKLRNLGHPRRADDIQHYLITKDIKGDKLVINNKDGYELYNFTERLIGPNGRYQDIRNNDIDSIDTSNLVENGDISFLIKLLFRFKIDRDNKAEFRIHIGYKYKASTDYTTIYLNIIPVRFDRRSALKFKRTILKECLGKSILPELLMLLNIDTKIYQEYNKALENISINAMTSEKTNINILQKSFTRDMLNEALSPDTYKKWSKDFNWEHYNSLEEFFKTFSDSDRNHNRIYFDLKVNTDNFKITVPDEISDFFGWYGYPIIDYNVGICRDKDGRNIRIGRLLNRLGEDKLLATYNKSKENTLKNVGDLQVVISRHPYDIIGMSTDRGWTTCHDINDQRYGGKHLWAMNSFLRGGGMIAYLIRKSDRNINNPISRTLIKKGFKGDYMMDHHVYGTRVKEFEDFVNKWCKKLNSFNRNIVKEELSPETYKSAANKLQNIGHVNRAKSIKNWIEHNKKDDNIRNDEYFYKISNNYYKFSKISYYINGEKSDENGNIDVDAINYEFDGELYSCIYFIFENRDGQDIEAVHFIFDIRPRSLSISIDSSNYMFDDRQSAIKFKKEILPKLFDFVNISDIFIILNTDVEIYKTIIDVIENVNINYLYLDNESYVKDIKDITLFMGKIIGNKLVK